MRTNKSNNQEVLGLTSTTTGRTSTYPISSLILNRWSPRALTGEELAEEELMSLFEAARWAPSGYNSQLWRFIYAKKGTPYWGRLFDLLVDFNKSWAKNASALVVVISKKTFEHNGASSSSYRFDAGAASENLALEAAAKDLATHFIGGFDHVKAREELQIPEDYDVITMIAIGKRAPKEILPIELQDMEVPSGRRPLKEILMEGKFQQ